MKKVFLSLLLSFGSANAFAVQLICESNQKSESGKAMKVYKFNSKAGSMERFAYIPSRGGYVQFGQLDHLVFSDDLFNMMPMRRTITAKMDGEEILNATWSNGAPTFTATIANEESEIFACKWKE